MRLGLGLDIGVQATGGGGPAVVAHTEQGARNEPAFETYTDTDVLTVGVTYDFTLVISNYTSGAVRVGINTMLVGKRAIDNAAANGTFTGQLTISADPGDTDFTWRAQSAGFVGTIDRLDATPV